jgi:hypothetical protein
VIPAYSSNANLHRTSSISDSTSNSTRIYVVRTSRTYKNQVIQSEKIGQSTGTMPAVADLYMGRSWVWVGILQPPRKPGLSKVRPALLSYLLGHRRFKGGKRLIPLRKTQGLPVSAQTHTLQLAPISSLLVLPRHSLSLEVALPPFLHVVHLVLRQLYPETAPHPARTLSSPLNIYSSATLHL